MERSASCTCPSRCFFGGSGGSGLDPASIPVEERTARRELIIRADSYLSLLWHRYVAPDRKDIDLSYNIERTIGDLREASRLPAPPSKG